MVELEICFDLSNLQRLAELSPKNCFDTHGVAGFHEDRDGFHGQQGPDTRDLLR
jgi:hypothetical protein